MAYKLLEYTADGILLREISLEMKIERPVHAVETADGQFVVSHGLSNSLNRVCIVDSSGTVMNSYGNNRGSAAGQLNGPRQLAIDANGFVMIADHGNKRVVVLTPSMSWSHALPVIVDGHLQKTYALHLNESCAFGRLFVGDMQGRLMVFDRVTID